MPLKAFIIKVFHFTVILVSYTGIMYLTNLYILKADHSGMQRTDILIVGDSHPQTAIDPDLFSSAASICKEAEPYYISYWKLKNYLQNHNVDTLLIGFSYHNISEFNDMKLSDPFWSAEMFRRIYSLMSYSELKDLEIDVDLSTFLRVEFNNMCLYPQKHTYNLGGFEPETRPSDLTDIDGIIKRHYFYNNRLAEISYNSIQYLDSILSLSRGKNIVPVLVSNPLYGKYREKIPERFILRYAALKDRFRKQGVIILDESLKDFPDDYFFNPDHLNLKGAEKFTNDIIEALKMQRN